MCSLGAFPILSPAQETLLWNRHLRGVSCEVTTPRMGGTREPRGPALLGLGREGRTLSSSLGCVLPRSSSLHPWHVAHCLGRRGF